MKLFTILAALTLCTQAQAATPADACRELSRFNPSLGVECLGAVSKGKIQEDVVNACLAAGRFQPEVGVSCLRQTLNKRYEAAAVTTCQEFSRFDASQIKGCFQTIENKTYSKDEIQMCSSNGRFDAAAGISCLGKLGKKDDFFGCPTNEALLQAVRNVRVNLRAERIDFNQSMGVIIDQVMRQIDRAAMAEKTLAAIEFALQTCQR
jgi:hypothetical protein